MGRILPILFNADMVRAILDGRKTATRRVVRYKYSNTEMKMHTDKYGTRLIEIKKNIEGETYGKNPDGSTWHKLLPYIEKDSQYKKGDIMYVRETWGVMRAKRFDACVDIAFKAGGENKRIFFPNGGTDRANRDEYDEFIKKWDKTSTLSWHPSIHMPKEAARIWLKVTDVRVERLQDITNEEILREGASEDTINHLINQMPEKTEDFIRTAYLTEWSWIWDSTIKKAKIEHYGYDANPWVWVIEFERCEKPVGNHYPNHTNRNKGGAWNERSNNKFAR